MNETSHCGKGYWDESTVNFIYVARCRGTEAVQLRLVFKVAIGEL